LARLEFLITANSVMEQVAQDGAIADAVERVTGRHVSQAAAAGTLRGGSRASTSVRSEAIPTVVRFG